MEPYDVRVGKLLRQHRKARNLTLQQAAKLLNTSTPVLSRKERGQEAVSRLDLRLAIQMYGLMPWQAYELWLNAGLIPEGSARFTDNDKLYSIASIILPGLHFPLLIMDSLGYIKAWNQGMETVWSLSRMSDEQIHWFDLLFSGQMKHMLREAWQPYVEHALYAFYRTTLAQAHESTFTSLLDKLSGRYGTDFVTYWNQAKWRSISTATVPSTALNPVRIHYDGLPERIEFLELQFNFCMPDSYGLCLLIPCDETNHKRFEEFWCKSGNNQVYWRN